MLVGCSSSSSSEPTPAGPSATGAPTSESPAAATPGDTTATAIVLPSASATLASAPTCVPATPLAGLAPTPEGRFCTPADVPTPVPTAAPTFAPDADLQSLVETVLGDQAASYAVYVKNLDEGSGAAVNEGRVYVAASLFKLYVMWEAFRQEALGLLRFDEELLVTEYYTQFELGTNLVEAGDLVTVEQALRYMISVSDTPTAVLLQDRVGSGNVNRALQALGIEDSGLFYPEGTAASARGVAILLEAIARGSGIEAEAREAMIELMASETIDNGLRAGVPPEVKVAHKTGLLQMARHQAAIVFSPAATYVLVILWDRQSETNLFKDLSRAVYAYYNQT